MTSAVPGMAETEGGECQNFAVRIEIDRVSFFDHGEDGVGAGDRRIGRYNVLSMDGSLLGEFVFVATVLPPTDDGQHELFADALYTLPGGTLATTLHYQLSDAAETATGATQDFVYPVTGGTGAFAGVRGTLASTTDDEGGRVHAFTLTCSD